MNPFKPELELGASNDAAYSCRRALIESIDGGTDVCVTEGSLKRTIQNIPQPPPLPVISRSVIENQMGFEGWKHEDNAVD